MGILRHNRGESPKYHCYGFFSANPHYCVFFCGRGCGRCSCHNKRLLWLISTLFFHVKNSRIIVWLFFTHTRFYFHVHIFFFTDSFYDIFTERKQISGMESQKYSKIFTEGILIFTGKKRCHHHLLSLNAMRSPNLLANLMRSF